ncbi:hypothetical protein PR048_012341 [Dryococelus australis]|uniref:Uncharacterized protein n=1 Tax=Dryococelus australis TaxID=614101 RepID=A0ABQ9HPF8_9NEOP|nr:hypothetical protein PR048_012341 [Dryococelus australis]
MDLHFTFICGDSTAGNIVRETCQAVWNTLHSMIIHIPPTDGKHVRIIKPTESGFFLNYKISFSLITLAVPDLNYKYCLGHLWKLWTFFNL